MTEHSLLNENHYKECSPSKTVERISNLISRCGITTEYISKFESSIDTCSVRLVIKDTDIGSNGKGMNEAFAIASASAEFIERLENLHLDSFTRLIPNKEHGFYLYPDERIIPFCELVSQNDPFLALYFKMNGDDKNTFLDLHTLDYAHTGIKNAYISVPFYDYKIDKEVYLPYTIYRPWYGSNGMCAGNTSEEALVQGLSEIIERYVMKIVVSERISLPDIPEEYLKKYPDLYSRYRIIASDPKFMVRLIDCSLGGKYPVAGLLVVEKNTGNYGLKFGAHPCYKIAIERTLTEATQGQDIFSFASNSFLDFSNENVFSEENLANCFMTGQGQYPYQLFSGSSQYVFCEPKDNSNLSNKELLLDMIADIQNEGYHVLIRDVSYLGFPAFHIVVPGLSETGTANRTDYEMIHLLNNSIDLFRYPEKVNKANAPKLQELLSHFFYQHYLSFFAHTQYAEKIPFEYAGESARYYQALLSIALGDYSEGIVHLTSISKSIPLGYISEEDQSWLLALMYYLSASIELSAHNEIMSYLKVFFDDTICNKLNECFNTQENDGFNSVLFRKLAFKYEANDIDDKVEAAKKNNSYSMINHMPKQKRVV